MTQHRHYVFFVGSGGKVVPLHGREAGFMRIFRVIFGVLCSIIFFSACKHDGKKADNGAFRAAVDAGSTTSAYDLSDIQESGELIVATLSGPDTYYDYQGVPMGVQYAYAAAFAQEEGVRVRMEIAHDTLELFRLLRKGEADVIALPLPRTYIRQHDGLPAGMQDSAKLFSWAVRKETVELAAALDKWFAAGELAVVHHKEAERYKDSRRVRRTVRAPYISQEKGVISSYDRYFQAAAKKLGWDWHLIAAQCYQESGFDPAAVSGAGARGLMQIMPGTAQYLGVPEEHLFHPDKNIAAAAKYLQKLEADFRDIGDPEERIKFVLGAYNGGPGHIRDAMALARKYHRRPDHWDDVSIFVRGLSEPKYYRDPVVKYGYMIGRETAGYVNSVMDRWRFYGKNRTGGPKQSHRRRGRYQRPEGEVKIYRPDDPEFSGISKN